MNATIASAARKSTATVAAAVRETGIYRRVRGDRPMEVFVIMAAAAVLAVVTTIVAIGTTWHHDMSQVKFMSVAFMAATSAGLVGLAYASATETSPDRGDDDSLEKLADVSREEDDGNER